MVFFVLIGKKKEEKFLTNGVKACKQSGEFIVGGNHRSSQKLREKTNYHP